jgi:5,6-dimethylbenzimidazole synthase
MFDPEVVREKLHMPQGSRPIALLCVGEVEQFYPAPMLEIEKWDSRRPLSEVLFENSWGEPSRDAI